MDLVAKRDIQQGEAIAIDYATFAVDFAPFDCHCGKENCRGRISSDDVLHAQPDVLTGQHVTAHIWRTVLQHRIGQALVPMEGGGGVVKLGSGEGASVVATAAQGTPAAPIAAPQQGGGRLKFRQWMCFGSPTSRKRAN